MKRVLANIGLFLIINAVPLGAMEAEKNSSGAVAALPRTMSDDDVQFCAWKNAIEAHNALDKIEKLIKEGNTPDVCAQDGCTPLHYAAARGKTKVMTRILSGWDYLIDRHMTHDEPSTPLAMSIACKQSYAACFLIRRGAFIDMTSQKGVSLLMLATHYKLPSVVQELLRRKGEIDIDEVTCMGANALSYACVAEQENIARMLIQAGASVNTLYPIHENTHRKESLLHKMVRADKKDFVKLLMESGSSLRPDNDGLTPLHTALWQGKTDLVPLMFGRQPESHEMTRLCKETINVVQRSIQRKRESEDDVANSLPCYAAVTCKNQAIMRIIFNDSSHLKADEHGLHPLGMAATSDNMVALEFLLKKESCYESPEIFAQCKDDAMSLAIRIGHKDAIQTLFESGAAIKRKDIEMYKETLQGAMLKYTLPRAKLLSDEEFEARMQESDRKLARLIKRTNKFLSRVEITLEMRDFGYKATGLRRRFVAQSSSID